MAKKRSPKRSQSKKVPKQSDIIAGLPVGKKLGPRVTSNLVDLHQRIQNFIFEYLKVKFNDPDLKLSQPLPDQLNTVQVMRPLVEAIKDEIKKSSWRPVNPGKFVLGAAELFGAIQAKPSKPPNPPNPRPPLSSLIQYVYHKLLQAIP